MMWSSLGIIFQCKSSHDSSNLHSQVRVHSAWTVWSLQTPCDLSQSAKSVLVHAEYRTYDICPGLVFNVNSMMVSVL